MIIKKKESIHIEKTPVWGRGGGESWTMLKVDIKKKNEKE